MYTPGQLNKNLQAAISRKQAIIIVLIWALINTFFLVKNGVVTTGEADKYITEAKELLSTGHLRELNFGLYFVQISLIAFCIKFHLSFVLIVALQLVCNLWATLYFYKLLAQVFVQPLMAFAGTLILLINFPYQEFNTFLQTESLFYSFTLIFSCYLLSMQNLKAKNIFIIVIALSLISITRPTGMLFIPPTFIYLFFKFFKKWRTRNKIFVASFTAIAFLYVLDKAIGSGGQFDFMLTFRDERIICGVPTLPGFINIKTTENGNSIYGLLYYITHNFSQFARMAWLRTVAFWGLFRSYFSFWHNAYLVLYFYPLHVCAIPGTKKFLKHKTYPALYFILLILIIWSTTMLSCDDWHNRFYLSLSPYIIVLGVYAFNKIPKTANVQP